MPTVRLACRDEDRTFVIFCIKDAGFIVNFISRLKR